MDHNRSIEVVRFLLSGEVCELGKAIADHKGFTSPLAAAVRNHYPPSCAIGRVEVVIKVETHLFPLADVGLLVHNESKLARDCALVNES
jgi:hypothetical protein